MEKCTKEHFKKASQEDFDDANLSYSLCFPVNFSGSLK